MFLADMYAVSVENKPQEGNNRAIPTPSAFVDDGTAVELTCRPAERRTLLSMYGAGRWALRERIECGSDSELVPFSPNNNLIKNESVLLPSEPRIYGSEQALVSDVQGFIHRYVDRKRGAEARRIVCAES